MYVVLQNKFFYYHPHHRRVVRTVLSFGVRIASTAMFNSNHLHDMLINYGKIFPRILALQTIHSSVIVIRTNALFME